MRRTKSDEVKEPQPMPTVLSIDPLPTPSPLLSTGARSTASLASPGHYRQRSFTSGRFEVVDFDTDDSLADDLMFMESGAPSTVSSVGSSTGFGKAGGFGESSRIKDFKVSATVLPRYKSDLGMASAVPESTKSTAPTASAAPVRKSPKLRTALSVPLHLIDDSGSAADVVGRFQIKDISPDDETLKSPGSEIVSSRKGVHTFSKPPPVVKAASDPVSASSKQVPRSVIPTAEMSKHSSTAEPLSKVIAKKKALVSRPSMECMCSTPMDCSCKKVSSENSISSSELLRRLESLAHEVEFLKTENTDLRKSVISLQKEVAMLKSSR